ncbi:hypothetical protein ACLKA7_009060 [Drosophila subpalustris]
MEQLISRGRRITIQRHSDSIHKLIEAVEESDESVWNGCSENYKKSREAKEASWNSIVLNLEAALKANSATTSGQSSSTNKPRFAFFEAMAFLRRLQHASLLESSVPPNYTFVINKHKNI